MRVSGVEYARRMAVSPSFLTYVLEQLAGVRLVTSRRMFGGVGLYRDDVFFAVIDNHTLFFKVDDQTRLRYTKRRMPPFAPMPDKPPMRSYYQVPPGVIEDADQLIVWAREAVAVGAASPPKSKSARTPR
jgi:DNA transformation protein